MQNDAFNGRSEAEVRYQHLIEHMNEAVWVGDENERTVYANPKFCDLMESTVEELVGRESYEFWDEASVAQVKKVNSTDRIDGVSSSYEGNLKSKSGKLIPVLLNGTPLPGGGTLGIMTDLRELKKRESLYRTLVEKMNEPMWMGDENERTIYANPKLCELLECNLADLIGGDGYAFWDFESQKKIRAINQNERKHGISSSYEANLRSMNGNNIPVLVHGSPLPNGGTMSIMTDLTELHRREEAERVLGSAIQFASDAIVILDEQARVISWNKGAKIIFGFRQEEMMHENLDLFLYPEDLRPALFEGQIMYQKELLAKHKTGHEVQVSATVTPIFNEDSTRPSHFLIIARDISDIRRFESELSARYEKLREAYSEFGKLRRQMDYIFEVMNFFRETKDPRLMADYFVSSVIMLTGVNGCVLRAFDEQESELRLLSVFGMTESWRNKGVIKYKGGLVEKAFNQGRALKIVDLMNEPLYKSHNLARSNNFSSMMVIPLQFQSKLVGSLSIYATAENSLKLFDNSFIEKYARILEIGMGMILNGEKKGEA